MTKSLTNKLEPNYTCEMKEPNGDCYILGKECPFKLIYAPPCETWHLLEIRRTRRQPREYQHE